MSNFRLLHGDVRKTLGGLESNSIHCAVTSPPYYPSLRNYNIPLVTWKDDWEGCLGDEETPQQFVNHLVECFTHVKRVLRTDGILWVNIGDSYAKNNRWNNIGIKKKDLLCVPFIFAISMRSNGWYLRSDCIFHKTDAMPKSCTDRCGEDHEYIFQFTKTDKYYFDRDAIRIETDKYSHYARTVWNMACSNYKGNHVATFPEKLPATAIKVSTSEHGVCLECGAPYKRITEKTRIPTRPAKNNKVDETHKANRDPQRHITKTQTVGWEKSCDCLTNAIKRPTVLDPFSGAGTTGVACKNLNCNYIGCDISSEYIDDSEKRIINVRDNYANSLSRW